MQEKEKLLFMTKFSMIFSQHFQQHSSIFFKIMGLFDTGLTLSKTNPGFYVSVVQVFGKHCGKRRNCSWRAISPFPTVFSTLFGKLSAIFIKFKIVVCQRFEFGSLKFVVWERVNPFPNKLKFLRVCSTSLLKTLWEKISENTVGKGEIARNEQFLLFPQCFLPFLENFLPFSSNLKLVSANSHFGSV